MKISDDKSVCDCFGFCWASSHLGLLCYGNIKILVKNYPPCGDGNLMRGQDFRVDECQSGKCTTCAVCQRLETDKIKWKSCWRIPFDLLLDERLKSHLFTRHSFGTKKNQRTAKNNNVRIVAWAHLHRDKHVHVNLCVWTTSAMPSICVSTAWFHNAIAKYRMVYIRPWLSNPTSCHS